MPLAVVTVIVVLPLLTPVTLPFSSTVATSGLLLLHVNVVTALVGFNTTLFPRFRVEPIEMLLGTFPNLMLFGVHGHNVELQKYKVNGGREIGGTIVYLDCEANAEEKGMKKAPFRL